MGHYGQIRPAVAPRAAMTDDMIPFAPLADGGATLRRAFGQFGTGVTIITAMTDRGPLGMTANSFSSVSLAPPLVLWSAAKRSQRHDAFATAAHFCIHVLGQDQQALAQHFAAEGEVFDDVHWATGPDGAPALKGCLAAFHCDRYNVHEAGDHSVIIGEIKHAAVAQSPAQGLLFHQGRFGSFAAKADTETDQ